jgi:hypothetical protein
MIPFESLTIHRVASLSECGRYRWSLTRSWHDDLLKPWVGWIMLNPSTADADIDDPTIRRCMGFAHDWGYFGIHVVNLFSFRAADPADLAAAADPIAPPPVHPRTLEKIILPVFEFCPLVVAAWGSHDIVKLHAADIAVRALCCRHKVSVACLASNGDGQPRHPLYVKAGTRPRIWFDGQDKEAT